MQGSENEKINLSIENSEKTGFEKFETKVKTIIFEVLFVLLKEEEISVKTAVIMSLIEFFQL